jgi:predicted RNase H-like HicB family nuclease
MSQEFWVIVEKDSDGYFVASVPSLPGCHTQAKSLDELMERIQEAIELCIEFDNRGHKASLCLFVLLQERYPRIISTLDRSLLQIFLPFPDCITSSLIVYY